MTELLGARSEVLDCYSRGIRVRFAGLEQLQSPECRSTLEGDFRNHGHSISQIERLNAELTRGHNPRAPARSFARTAAHSVLPQAKEVHKRRGGDDPLAPAALYKQPLRETLSCNPLVLSECASPPSAAVLPPARSSGQLDGSTIEDGYGGSSTNALANGAGGPADALASRHSGAFGAPILLERANTSILGARDAGHPEQDENKAMPSRRGLSPYMLAKNQHLASARSMLGRPMTAAERDQYTAEFKTIWARTDTELFQEAYRE